MPDRPTTTDDLAAVETAVRALEQQRAVLGDAVVETALAPLLARRDALLAQPGEQRRLVTVVFADLVDFTVLSRTLDAEDTRAVMDGYFRQWQAVIERHGGVVEKFIGDAVMAVFGLYRSHEDDAQRAVRAALEMRDLLPGLAASFGGALGGSLAVAPELQMRVGIDTGEVVVSTLGERAGHEFVAVGQTVNRASRLQSAAPVDAVLISAPTHRLVRGLFSFDAAPGLVLKGISEPVDAWRVLAERPRAFRVEHDGTVAGVAVPTVGRERELAGLREALEDVTAESRWRIVTVLGDAGVGKSRVLFELDRWLSERPENTWWLRGRAAPSDVDRPLALLRDVIAGRFAITDSDPPAAVRRKLRAGFHVPSRPPDTLTDEDLAGYDDGTLDTSSPHVREADVVGAWLGFAMPDGVGNLSRDPQSLRTEATVALGRFLVRLSKVAPVVALLEDLHWADDASLHWLEAADEALGDRPVLVVATARPSLLDRRPHWGEGLAHHSRLSLEPLSRRRTRELLARILGVDEPPEALDALVVDASEGNPFYVEELVSWLLESGGLTRGTGGAFTVDEDGASHVEVPTTLRGVLQARLDTLGHDARGALERAAVVGRVFWDDAVATLVPEPVEALDPVLADLRRHELVRRRATSTFDATAEYMFAHALLRDVAYEGVLRAHRRDFHRLAAGWLTRVTERSGRTDEYAGVIAEHLELAGDARAADWYLRAGRRAAAVHAAEEAERLLGRALAVAPPDGTALRFDATLERWSSRDRSGDRAGQAEDQAVLDELATALPGDDRRHVHLALSRSRRAFEISDYGPAAERALDAVELARGLDADDLLPDALLAAGMALVWGNDLDAAQPALTEALATARAVGNARVEAEALRYLSMVTMNRGDYARALELLDQSHQVAVRHGDVDQQTRTLLQTSQLSFYLGRYEEALATSERALPRVRASGYRYAVTVALGNLASFAFVTGRIADSYRWARESLTLALTLNDEDAQAVARYNLGTVAYRLGDLTTARTELLGVAANAESLGRVDYAMAVSGVLAMVELDDGRPDEALARVEQTLALAAEATSPKETSEALIQCAWVLMDLGDVDRAADVLERARPAVEGAADHHALVLEHAAALVRVASERGQVEEAARGAEALVESLGVTVLHACARPAGVLAACRRALDDAGDPRAPAVARLGEEFTASVHAAASELGLPRARGA
ncbi:ATP-binding protein [Cellulomonas sp. McL0617]|uniref:ATP-binding protein n=1 Tax=Cellulomonas sp. McL0617 TaxID=3415675 RepID=UPI003CF5A365